jgi:ectoine hydroxylase
MPILSDPYQTRLAGQAELRPRRDPVLHGERGPSPGGTVSAAQVESYEKNGYLFLPSFFTGGELEALTAERERLLNDPNLRQRDEVIVEPGSDAVRSIFAVHKLSDVMTRLAAHARLLDVVRHLLGSQVYIHQSRINYKPGFTGKEFYWHSDFETWHAEDGMPRMRALSCSVALTENNEHNGPLMVVPGSHHTYVACAGETPEDNFKSSLRRQEVGVPDPDSLIKLVAEGGIEAPKGPAGSVVLFECNLMHGSNSNISPWPRSNVFLVFNSVENVLQEPFCGRKPRPEYIAARQMVGL